MRTALSLFFIALLHRSIHRGFTLLQCGSAWVVLGHLKKGSVEVVTGQLATQGQRLGRVGNTGNTGEPHLHIHAQRPGTEEAPLSGEPLSIRFGERYPVRNARIGK